MLFEGTSLSLILLPVVILIFITLFIVTRRLKKRQMSPAEKSFKRFTSMAIAFGVVIAVLWFALPITPTLSTFGRPREINSLNEVLEYLQRYNDALVRTTEVVHAFLFMFLFWFLASLMELSRTISARSHEPSSPRADSGTMTHALDGD